MDIHVYHQYDNELNKVFKLLYMCFIEIIK